MAIHCYTSFTFSYLAKARVLARTLKRHHPDWVLWAVITDRPPEGMVFSPEAEVFDRILSADEMFSESWLFGHDVVDQAPELIDIYCRLLESQPDLGVEGVSRGPSHPLFAQLRSSSVFRVARLALWCLASLHSEPG